MKRKVLWLGALLLLLLAMLNGALAAESVDGEREEAADALAVEAALAAESAESPDDVEYLDDEDYLGDADVPGLLEAPDLTQECTITRCNEHRRWDLMVDGDYLSYWESGKVQHPWFIIKCPRPMYGLYLCFRSLPSDFELQVRGAEWEQWVTLMPGESRFHHSFYELHGETEIRVYSLEEGKHNMGLFEMFVFGQGEIPSWVQRWEPTEEKADILFFSAHPDDELLFYGGAIPTYAAELNKRVIVAYLTYGTVARRTEALNGLWAAGVRHYPVFGGFKDSYSTTLKAAYAKAGELSVVGWVVELYRKYHPDVVVTHDLDGEYGHGQHRMLADAAIQAYNLAADPDRYPTSFGEYGTWEVKKLYLHLFGDETSQIVFDWNVPLSAFGGRTSLDVAKEAYALHVTQQKAKVRVHRKWTPLTIDEMGVDFPHTVFGLYASRVGPDRVHNDFLENIEE